MGSILIVLGSLILFNPTPTSAGFHIPKILGPIFIVIGVFSFIYALVFKKSLIPPDNRFGDASPAFMCPNCRQPAFGNDFPDMECPNCHIQVEEVEGFYDRHPELRPTGGSEQTKI
jgi:hypothetical protein